MVVLRIAVVCCLSTMVQPLALAQLFNSATKDATSTADAQVASGTVIKADKIASEAPKSSDVKQTSWYELPMPKITMPKISMPAFSMPSFLSMGGDNSGDQPSIFTPITEGAKKVSHGGKKAWAGAKEMFSFGREETGSATSKGNSKEKPSFWGRMFTPKEPEGPRTVAEFMAQPRLDP